MKRRGARGSHGEIFPEEIFLDSENLSALDRHQLEGRMEKPIEKRVPVALGAVFFVVLSVFLARVAYFEIVRGEAYYERSQRNHLRYTPLFADRGAIIDRTGVFLARNVASTIEGGFAFREYVRGNGLSHILGYVKYPAKDTSGFYYKEETEGVAGVEQAFDAELRGRNGLRIAEVDARGTIESKNIISPPLSGRNLTLSIDLRVQEKLFDLIKRTAEDVGFVAGAGVLMDVSNGEILALASYPEYSSQILSDGSDAAAIKKFIDDPHKPFLNRVTDGLYTPGSIVKPFVAMGALSEGIITPEQKILSTGSISIPNPFDSAKKSVFTDWKAHGLVDMRRAIAVSSNVYFYEVGGGFEGRVGLGIGGLERYLRLFGFGESLSETFFSGKDGVIPNPEWKRENFKGDLWRIGDTYNTSIGQYGVLVTPIQAVRATAAIANNGMLLSPSVVKGEEDAVPAAHLPLSPDNFEVVREGMRDAVLFGTAHAIELPNFPIAAKTGTAELGVSKEKVNSWIIGFYPYGAPRYAFAVIMEKGDRQNTIGALFVMKQLLEWMSVATPEYLN